MLDFLKPWIQSILGNFRTKNPLLFLVVIALLGAINYFVMNAAYYGIDIPGSVQGAIVWIDFIIAAITTTPIEENPKE